MHSVLLDIKDLRAQSEIYNEGIEPHSTEETGRY